MKNNFSKEVIIMLKKVGWYEGRHIDISKVETKFNDKGIKLFPVAREILQEFNDLKLSLSEQTWFCIDALEGIDVLQEDDNDLEQITYLYKILNK